MDGQAIDSDAVRASSQKAGIRQQQGKLKIFFGMAAGVGKTYAMLKAARRLKAEGVDVVAGVVETHGHAETEALLQGFEIIPRQRITDHGASRQEMDVDAILTRNPQLVLVDDLAHTNIPGVRHLKRYQDIQELLSAGINVYTTVNVQHFESRADVVRQITGITVHETVPDSLLDLADEIELIDLSPEELRKRLAEGRVQTTESIETAANSFFRVGNLTALREMALRLTAERVDHQLQNYMHVKQITGPWKSGERLMVAVGPSLFSERLIRWTRRMAYNLDAPWIAAHVETPELPTATQKERLAANLALVRDLGGEVVITAGRSISDGLLRVAHQRNVTQIVVGKSIYHPLRNLLRGGSLVDRLLRVSGDIDIYVVTGDKSESEKPARMSRPRQHSRWRQYFLSLLVVTGTTLVNLFVLPVIGYQAVGLTELLAVLLIAIYIGRGPALLAAVFSAISWNYLFLHPRFTFAITHPEDIILFGLYFAIAIFTGNLTARLRTQEQQARYNAERMLALYTLAHEIASAVNMDDVLRTAVTQIGRGFDAEVAVLLPQNGKLTAVVHPHSTLKLEERDFSAAQWVHEKGKPAGRFTDTSPNASAQFLPLTTSNRTLGVIGIRTHQTERLPFDQQALLETFVNQVALVVERELLDEAAEQSAMLKESERLYTTLLNSISHELRTPIAAITGASSLLLAPNTQGGENARLELTRDIQHAAERLNRLVANLLDMSRLDAGRLKLKLEWCDVSDVIGVAAKRVEKDFTNRQLIIDYARGLPLVQMDFVLMEQVIVNLLDNACAYTPPGTSVKINASIADKSLLISITDSGRGIPPQDLERIFDKFYRVPGTATGGTGLGLSICRGLVEAHGGTLSATNMPEGGARFIIRLPITNTPPPVREAAL